MHPLLRTARRTKIDVEICRPAAATYDFAGGVWRDVDGLLSNRPDQIPQTKKFDVETGEDAKGQ